MDEALTITLQLSDLIETCNSAPQFDANNTAPSCIKIFFPLQCYVNIVHGGALIFVPLIVIAVLLVTWNKNVKPLQMVKS